MDCGRLLIEVVDSRERRPIRVWDLLVPAVLSTGALVVSTTSSTTRGDLVFGLISWLLFVVFAIVGAAVVLVVILGLRRWRRGQTATRSAAVTAMVAGVVLAFPVGAEWDQEGFRASGLVPVAQALVQPIWPRSAWNSERPRPPIVGYAYSCCG